MPRDGGDIFNGFEHHVARGAGHDLFDGGVQRSKKIHADRYVRQKRDQHDQAGKKRQKKTEGHAVGTCDKHVLVYFFVNETHQIIQRDLAQSRKGVRFSPFLDFQPNGMLGKIPAYAVYDALDPIQGRLTVFRGQGIFDWRNFG